MTTILFHAYSCHYDNKWALDNKEKYIRRNRRFSNIFRFKTVYVEKWLNIVSKVCRVYTAKVCLVIFQRCD